MANILGQIMASAQNMAAAGMRGNRGTSEEDALNKENRTAWRKLMEGAIKEGTPEQRAALLKNAPTGIDLESYRALAGMTTPEQEAQSQFNTLISNMFKGRMGTTATSTTPSTTPPSPPATQPGQTATQETVSPTPAPTTGQGVSQPLQSQNIFTDDFLLRSAVKKFANIDVGAHYFDAPQWFESYGQLVNSGVPVEQAVNETAIKYGFIPDGASNLQGLTKEDRGALFEREFSSALSDPTIDAIIRKVKPSLSDEARAKAKAGFVLEAFAAQGRYIPDHYQPLLDRFRGLEDPNFISDDLKTWAYTETGKRPHELTASDISKARTAMQDFSLQSTMSEAYFRKLGTTKADWELEMQKPISAEERAKQGIGSDIKTYQQLVDSGRRFATDADRKMYQELYTARTRLEGMEQLFFGTPDAPQNGIFTGVGVSATARAAARGRLALEKFNGTIRGRALEEFNDYKAYFARTLIKIAGESGSRLSDQDIAGIITTMPDVGRGLVGVPDSEDLARSKYTRALADMERLLKLLEDTTTVKPSGQPASDGDLDARVKSFIDKYGGKK